MRIVALQSKQPSTVAPAVVFPPAKFDLVVSTGGRGAARGDLRAGDGGFDVGRT
ncbi:hypothetical protein F4559_002782 [Saccharothrix violaceirubra]|uniref:Uncharacterized protein n=1 Tax=Saccharothrix violaceirubra TaxID=413306 RepID=A0A7W7T2L3_9PSEU|nr:hypothetical protein [Saccharothrix violaceirubra]